MSNSPTAFSFHRGAVFALLLPLMALTAFGQTSNKAEVQTLNTQPIERQIKGGETHVFRIDLKSGEYARAEVEQKNIDVVVSLFASDGKPVVEMDGRNGYLWREIVSCIAEKNSATFQVKVHAYGTAAQVGNYTIKLIELRPTQPADAQRLEAEQHLSKGRTLYLQEKPDYAGAIKEYEQAVKIWSTVGDKQWQAIALLSSGWGYSDSSKNDLALRALDNAVPLFQQTKDRIGEGKTANGIGLVYEALGQTDKAAQFYEQALKIRREAGDKRGEANTLYNLGDVHYADQQKEKAISYYEQALAIRSEMKDSSSVAYSLNKLGQVYFNLKQYEKAIEFFEKNLAITRELKERESEASTLSYLGNIHSILKHYDKAKESYEQFLEIKKDEEPNTYARVLLRMGIILYNLKQYEKAKAFLEKALSTTKDTNDFKVKDNALLGLRIISSPATASTSQTRAAASTEDAWPLPPLLAGKWETLDKQASQDLVDRLVSLASDPELAFVEVWARRITGFRVKQLSFYPGAQLCEGLEPGDGSGEATILTFLHLKDDTIEFLNGTSMPIHETNKKRFLTLDTQEKVESYLRFFTASIWAQEGNFRIVDGIDDFLWARDTTEADKQKVMKYMKTLRLTQFNPDGREYRATATLQYSTSLFRAVLYIDLKTGMIDMKKDMPIAVSLPFRRDKFDGPIRHEIGIYQ